MIKALNCPPLEWQAPDVQSFAAWLGNADALVTWAPWPWRNESQDNAQSLTDDSIYFAHSIHKPTYVCLPSPSLPPSMSEWEAWVSECAARYMGSTLVATNEPMNGGAISAEQVAEMSQSAAEIVAKAGHRSLLVGATDDWQQSVSVIRALHGWKPPLLTGIRGELLRRRLHVVYAHHHYNDVTYNDGRPLEVQRILQALDSHYWRCDRRVWLSEGGYRFATKQLPGAPYPADPAYWTYSDLEGDEAKQLVNLPRHYNWCKASGRVIGWANYEVRDFLWGGWASGLTAAEGATGGRPHPVARVWPEL